MTLPRHRLVSALSLSCWLLALVGVSAYSFQRCQAGETALAAPGAASNLPDSFYARKGLESMPRIAYDKVPVLNLKDAGADVTGTAVCNEVFLNSVATLQEQGGGILYIPAGIYSFSSPDPDPERSTCLKLEGLKNIHIVGDGPEQTVLQMTYDVKRWVAAGSVKTAYFLSFVKGENISLRNLGLSVFPYFRMRSPSIYEGAFAAAFSGNKGVQVVNVRTDQGRMGICFWAGNTEAWVVDCDARNTSADTIKFDHCQNIVAAYNHVERNNDDGFSGLAMTPNHMFAVNNKFLYNTLVFNNGWARGIVFSGHDHVVEGNWLEAQAGTPILFHQYGLKKNLDDQRNQNGKVIGNHMVRTGLSEGQENRLAGHRLDGAISVMHAQYDMEISDNTIISSGSSGIVFSSSWRPLYADNFIVKNNRVWGSVKYGIGLPVDKFDSTASKIQLTGNHANASGVADFFVTEKVTGLTGSGNRFTTAKTSADNVEVGEDLVEGTSDLAFNDPYRELMLAERPTAWELDFPAPQPGAAISAKDFGAKGDGKTNDIPALTAALAALAKTGGTLTLPAGDYLLTPDAKTDSLPFTCLRHHLSLVGASNVTIQGEAGKTRLIFTSHLHEGLRLIACKDVVVKDLELTYDTPRFHRWNRALLDVSGSQRAKVENIRTRNAVGSGIRIDSCRQVLVNGCDDQDSSQVGIDLWASKQIEVRGCRVKNARDHGIHLAAHGSLSRLPEYIRIIGNTIDGTREAYGLSLTSGTEVEVEDNRIANTYMSGICVYAMNPTFPHERLTVRANTLTSCGKGEFAYMTGAIGVARITGARRRVAGAGEILIAENTVTDSPLGAQIAWCENPEWVKLSDNQFTVEAAEPVRIDK